MSEKSKRVVGDQLMHFIREELDSRIGRDDSHSTIRRVPSDLLEGHEKYYIPKTVSIGPLHAYDISLRSADEQKRTYLKGFLSSFPQGTTVEQLIQELTKLEEKAVGDSTDQQLKAFLKGFISRFSDGTTVERLVQEMLNSEAKTLGHKDESLSSEDEHKKELFTSFICRFPDVTVKEHIIAKLMDWEGRARNYYAGQISLSSYEFLKTMLFDGCFIVELLLLFDWREIEKGNGRFQYVRYPLYSYQQDLLKLENQMPFFILSHLYDLVSKARPIGSENQSFMEVALSFCGVATGQKLWTPEPDIPVTKIDHLLHLVKVALFPFTRDCPREEFRPSTMIVDMDMPDTNRSPSTWSKKRGARELELAYGVKFMRLTNVPLPQIEFRNGVLRIPQLVLEESTPSLFSNILVSELSYTNFGTDNLFASYVIFMDSLISNDKDVEVLLRSGILQTQTNDVSELVSFFNGLSTTLRKWHLKWTESNVHSYFERLQWNVNSYCDSGKLMPIRGYLVNTFYESRWQILNNFLLFVLTVTQTLFSILGYSPSRKEK